MNKKTEDFKSIINDYFTKKNQDFNENIMYYGIFFMSVGYIISFFNIIPFLAGICFGIFIGNKYTIFSTLIYTNVLQYITTFRKHTD